MGQDRITGMAMMKMHRDRVPNCDKIIDKLAKSKRRLNFIL